MKCRLPQASRGEDSMLRDRPAAERRAAFSAAEEVPANIMKLHF
ncbi:hypothetical protein HMPREF3038_01968 [Akkermansia sp. KLE1797]|nr:hypothetical protein HMPREF3038_01968 [Akkermansia sp. KLE1797]KZA06036.1 hypothetical protein HMPREF1326_00300 [Akkermansia sp. KLE1605]